MEGSSENKAAVDEAVTQAMVEEEAKLAEETQKEHERRLQEEVV